jgi:transcription-repair coupling factor (superfamily II helicase)
VPSLKLQELLRGARVSAGFARKAKGDERTSLCGLTPAAKAFWIAGAASDDPRSEIVLAVVPSDRDVEQVTSDVRFFLGGLEGSSADELDAIVLPFPSQEVDPYRGLAPHLRIASARARALHAMAAGQARVVVASAAALLPRVSPPDAILALGLDLKPGDDVDTRRLAETLVDGGFTHQDPVDEHGEFCIRGGVIDIFPAGDDLPARIELVGDTIETIRRYAPDTQRSVATVDRLKVMPLREIVSGGTSAAGGGMNSAAGAALSGTNVSGGAAAGAADARVPVFEYLGIARRPVIVASEPDEIRERIEKQLAQISESYEQAAAVPASRGAVVGGARGLQPPGDILVSWPDIERHLSSAFVLEELGLDLPGAPFDSLQIPALAQGREAPGLHVEREEPAPSAEPALSEPSGRRVEGPPAPIPNP